MKKICGGNLFWGMQFRTCEKFWDFADAKSSLNPKIFHKYKSHTAITSIVLNEKCAKNAESNATLQTIEGFAVWLCTKFVPLLGNRTDGSLTTQWDKLRVNCIPKGKLPKQTNAQFKRTI